MEISLDHEKFEGVKELAAISTKIAMGRALISQLDDGKEEFLRKQEQELLERIDLALAASEDHIREIGKNHDELTKYRRELDGYCDSLRYFNERIAAFRKEADTFFKAENEKLDAKLKEIADKTLEVKKARLILEGDQKTVESARTRLEKEQRLLADRQGMVTRGFAELKRLKEKA